MTEHNDCWYCQSCFDEQFSYCDNCCEYQSAADFTEVDDDSVCSHCAECIGHTCQNCGELFRELSHCELCDGCQTAADEEAEEEETQRLADEEAETADEDEIRLEEVASGPDTTILDRIANELHLRAPTGIVSGQNLVIRCTIEDALLSVHVLRSTDQHDVNLRRYLKIELRRKLWSVARITMFSPEVDPLLSLVESVS